MRISVVTRPALPGRMNEDSALATPNAWIVVDGAGAPASLDTGCVHGVSWFARHLAAAIAAQISDESSTRSLAECLASAIEQVAGLHGSCELEHPGSPSATVVIAQRRETTLSYLVLADSTLIIRKSQNDLMTVSDDREAQVGKKYRQDLDSTPTNSDDHAIALAEYMATLRSHRNRPDGFWVASSDPTAAYQSLTGSVNWADVSDFALLSDGAARLVDRFGLATWEETMDVLRNGGPEDLIDAVRAAEQSDPHGQRWPRGKTFDDATAIYVQPTTTKDA